ncbi:MAG: type II toxin-antitoxin system RelE/ParE family toxin [Acidobacteriaceae bacterium]
MRLVIFTPAARADLVDARGWYEHEAPDLGRIFLSTVDVVIGRIRSNSRQFPVVHKSVRRVLLRRFPNALMFVIECDDALTVLACFHGSRDPIRWQQRM